MQYVGIGLLFALMIGLLLFFPIRASLFSKKFDTITNGMSYQEVIEILGEPRTTTTAQDITTCIWQKAILRGWTKSYVLTFKDGKAVLNMTNTSFN